MELRELLTSYGFPGDDIPIIRGSAKLAMEHATDPNSPDVKCIYELMDAVDAYIPNPARPVDKPFIMPVEDVFTITGRGTVVTGRIEARRRQGRRGSGDRRPARHRKKVVTGVEMFKKSLDQGQAGDNVGHPAPRRGARGRGARKVLAKPGSITPHTKFTAAVYVLGKDEGGRHTPFFNKLSPAVLLPHHGRHRAHRAGSRPGDGHAR